MISVAEYECDFCTSPFTARTADRQRGWARFCSKRCKAKDQEQKKIMWDILKSSGKKANRR